MSGGGGLIAHARATSDPSPVLATDQLPWPDHAWDPYKFKFSMTVLSEASVGVVTKWGEIQSRLNTRARASNGVVTVDAVEGIRDLVVLFEGESHGDDTPPLADLDIPEGLDTRTWQRRAIASRRGQSAFRRELLTVYAGRCAISGTRVADVLDAAHIAPHRGEHTNDPRNGLLLRTDIHTLFDLRRLTVLPSHQVRVDPDVGPEYGQFDGQQIAVAERRLGPDDGMLRRHNDACRWLR